MATGVFQRRFGDIEDLVYSFWAMLLVPRAGAVSRWSLQERKLSVPSFLTLAGHLAVFLLIALAR